MISDGADVGSRTPTPLIGGVLRLFKLALMIGVPIVLLAAWVGGFFYASGAGYMWHGDFVQRRPNALVSIDINRGLVIWIEQTADSPDPNFRPSSLNASFNDNFDRQKPGFGCCFSPSEKLFTERNQTWLGLLGFYHYSDQDDGQGYGSKSSFDAWMFPIAVIALPAWLPLAFLIRRKYRQKKRNAPGFPIVGVKQ